MRANTRLNVCGRHAAHTQRQIAQVQHQVIGRQHPALQRHRRRVARRPHHMRVRAAPNGEPPIPVGTDSTHPQMAIPGRGPHTTREKNRSRPQRRQ